MLSSETKRPDRGPDENGTKAAAAAAADIESLSARLQQIRHYLRQAGQLRRSVGGRQGRNLDSLMQQLAAQERQCSAELEDRLRRDAGNDMAADRQSEEGERDSEEGADQAEGDDADRDDEEEENSGPAAAADRPTIESKLGRHPDTADTSQCGDGDEENERDRDGDSGEELEALRNQRDLLRRMLQPAGSQPTQQQPQHHRQLPSLPLSSRQDEAEATTDAALLKRLSELESRRARLDRTLEELAALRADASTTSTEAQAAAGSLSASQTADEAAQLLGAMETMQARLDRLRSARDRLASVRQLTDDYRRSAAMSPTAGAQAGMDATAAERELRQLVLERQRLVDLQNQLELLHSAAGRDAESAAAALLNDEVDDEALGQQEAEEEEEAADADPNAGEDEDGSDADGDSATFPVGLEARERQQRRAQAPSTPAAPVAAAAQVAACLQQCCALLTAQQQQLHRLNQQVAELQQRQQQQLQAPAASAYQGYPGYWWGFWGQHHPYQQPQPSYSCADSTATAQRRAMSTTQATVGSQTDLADVASAAAAAAPVAESVTDTDEHSSVNAAGRGFDRLRESIYSEVAALISLNESRPHYLVELFRELQLLSTDSLRQRALQQLQRLVNGYLASRPPWLRDEVEVDDRTGVPAGVADVEQTPSESCATTSTATEEAVAAPADGRRRSSGSVSPFARDSLGDTAINLDRAMRQIRQQQQQRQHLLSSSSSGGRAAVAAGASASGRIDAVQLDRQVKSVVRHLIPALRAHAQEVATPQLLEWVANLALQRVKRILNPNVADGEAPNEAESSAASSTASAGSQDSEFDRFFTRQLAGLLADSLARFRGHRLADCTEDLLVDLSELLFNELAFFRLVNNLDLANDENEEAAATGLDAERNVNGDDGEQSEAESASAQPVDDYADDFEEAANSSSSDAEQQAASAQKSDARDSEAGTNKVQSAPHANQLNGDGCQLPQPAAVDEEAEQADGNS